MDVNWPAAFLHLFQTSRPYVPRLGQVGCQHGGGQDLLQWQVVHRVGSSEIKFIKSLDRICLFMNSCVIVWNCGRIHQFYCTYLPLTTPRVICPYLTSPYLGKEITEWKWKQIRMLTALWIPYDTSPAHIARPHPGYTQSWSQLGLPMSIPTHNTWTCEPA